MNQIQILKNSYSSQKEYVREIFEKINNEILNYKVSEDLIFQLSNLINNFKKPIIVILNQEEYTLKIYSYLLSQIQEENFSKLLLQIFENIEEQLLPVFNNLIKLAQAINLNIKPRFGQTTDDDLYFGQIVNLLLNLKIEVLNYTNKRNENSNIHEPSDKLKKLLKNYVYLKKNDLHKLNFAEGFKTEFIEELQIEVESINHDLIYNFETFPLACNFIYKNKQNTESLLKGNHEVLNIEDEKMDLIINHEENILKQKVVNFAEMRKEQILLI